MLQIAFLVAIWYAILDWRYVRRGGKRTSRSEKIKWFANVGALSLILIVVVGGFEGLAAAEEYALNIVIVMLLFAFIFYEAKRWHVRRDNPIQRIIPQ